MTLFLDTSVLLTACGSTTGASREVLRRASANNWTLVTTPYVLEEVLRHLTEFRPPASAAWAAIRPALVLMDDVLTLDRPTVFQAAKDRPILFSALAWADVLLTLDRADFGEFLDGTFYSLRVLKPGTFLEQERTAGRLK